MSARVDTAVYVIAASYVVPNTMTVASYLKRNAGHLSLLLTLATTVAMALRYLAEPWMAPLTHHSALIALLGFVLLLIALSLWSPQASGPPRLGLFLVILWSLAVMVSGASLHELASPVGIESTTLICALWALFATRHTQTLDNSSSALSSSEGGRQPHA